MVHLFPNQYLKIQQVESRLLHRTAGTTHSVWLLMRQSGTACCIRLAIVQRHTFLQKKNHILTLPCFLTPFFISSSHGSNVFPLYSMSPINPDGKLVLFVGIGRREGELWGEVEDMHTAAVAWQCGTDIVSSEASVNRLIGRLYCSCSCWLTSYIISEGKMQGTEDVECSWSSFVCPLLSLICFPSKPSKVIHQRGRERNMVMIWVRWVREGEIPPQATLWSCCRHMKALQNKACSDCLSSPADTACKPNSKWSLGLLKRDCYQTI